MITIEVLSKLYNDLTKLNPNYPILVEYKKDLGLIYRQLGIMVATPYLNHLYFRKARFKMGLLTQIGYASLMEGLVKLIQDKSLIEGNLTEVTKEYRLEVFKTYNDKNLDGPQQYVDLEFISIKNAFITKWIMKHFSSETRTLLKSINNEDKNR